MSVPYCILSYACASKHLSRWIFVSLIFFSCEKFTFVIIVLGADKFDEYNNHYIRMVFVLILHLLSGWAFDELSINPPETSDVVTACFNWTVKHEVQSWDSLVPHCASIVNFLSAPRCTTHITYLLTARPFESSRGWTIFNLWVSDHPPVAGPLAAYSPPQWHGQASRIWCRAGLPRNSTIYSPQIPNIFGGCVVHCFTKAL